MIRRFLLCALLICANTYAADMYRFGSRIVEVGDTAAKLIEVAGAPVYKERVENKEGGSEGERWQYQQNDHVVTFVIKDGKITSIE